MPQEFPSNRTRRIHPLFLIITLLFSVKAPSFAARAICDMNGNCVEHNSQPGPYFGTDPQHRSLPGTDTSPLFNLADQEPYRSSDMGPLGVVLSTGEFQLTATDLEIPGRGFPFRLERTYRSRRDGARSLLGFNWHLGYDEVLTPGTYSDGGVICQAIEWSMGNGWKDIWVDQCRLGMGWRAFVGFFGKIRPLPAPGGYQIRAADGMVKTFADESRDASGYRIWLLTRIEDRNGNALVIQHAGRLIDRIIDTLGRSITFAYDASGRLASATDFTGRSIVYAYDARGDLVSVRSPIVTGTPNGNDFPAGKTTLYRYLGAQGCSEAALRHNLASITDPRGTTFLTNFYTAGSDPSCGETGTPADTVAAQAYGGGPEPPRVRYAYAPVAPGQAPDANVVTTEATVTDRNGNIQVHRFNVQGNPLSIEQKTNREVRGGEGDYLETNTYVIDADGEQPMLVSRHAMSGGEQFDRDGHRVAYAWGMTEERVYYDPSGLAVNPDPFQKGNVLQVVRTPGPRGAPAGQEQQVTAYDYEPLFNQPVRITDPRGHVTTLTYDYQEGSYAQLTAGTVSDAVNPLWWTNNEVGAWMSLPGSSGLSDLNGDGYHRGGNCIKTSEGVARDFSGAPVAPGPADEIASVTSYNAFGLPMRVRDAEYNEISLRYFPESNPDGDALPTPPPADGRVLSSLSGEVGGGYLKEKLLDATPVLPLPQGVGASPRESGQSPPPRNILLLLSYDAAGNVKSATDGRGIRTDTWVNALNQIVQIAHAATGSSETPPAPAFAYLEQRRYDANNNLVQQRTERRDDGATTPPAMRRWITKDFTYDALDHRISETVTTDDVPALSLTTSYAYDTNGNLRKTIFPAGNAFLRFYDERDLLFREVALSHPSSDPNNMAYDPAIDSVTEYSYDGSGSVIEMIDPEGHATRSGYDGYDRKVVGFDAAYQKAVFTYDAGGHLLEQISYGTLGGPTPAPAGPPAAPYPEISHQRSFYDELGRLRRTDTRFFKYAGAALTALTGDGDAGLASVPACTGRPAEECDPLPARGDGWTTRLIAYDRLSRPVRTVDDNGHASETRYDGMGRTIKTLANVVSPFTLDPANPLANRNATDFVYDADGNLTQKTETELGADRSGPTPRLLPAQQHRSTFRYDALNRPIEAVVVGRVGAPALNLTTRIVYDSRGNQIQVTDPAGGRSKSFYDGLNRLTRSEAGYVWNGSAESIPAGMINASNPDGKITTSYAYDPGSRLLSITDDNNRVTTFQYDGLGRRIRIVYPDGSTRQTGYNRDSLATSWTQASGTGSYLSAATRFDGLHRPVRIDVSNNLAPWVAGTQRQSFEYDGAGRMTLAEDDADSSDGLADSTVALAYSSMGGLLFEAQTWRDASSGTLQSATHVVASTYDGVGFRTSVLYPDDRTVSYLPDALSRVESIVDSLTGTTRYDYLGARLLNRLHPNGTKLTLLGGPTDNLGSGYDDARRVIDFAHKLSSTQADLARFAYGYDAAGNRLSERRVHEISGALWKGETYAYDAVHRVVGRQEGTLDAAGSLQGAAGTSQDFTLDGLGNWRAHRKNAATYTQSVNALNQYTLFNGPAGPRALSYDFLGNLSSESSALGDQQYLYDFLNRLTGVLDPGGNLITYRYDALGRRISKSVNGIVQARYVYDGSRLIQEREGLSPARLVASYVYGGGSDELITRRRWLAGAGTDLFYHTNALGSVAAVTSSAGAVAERYVYDAYGQPTFLSPAFVTLTSSAVLNDILFTGRRYDPQTHLYDFRARTYHPYLGRFLQRDPLGESASLNLYNYVFNNPVNATDPTGMWSPPPGVFAAAMREEHNFLSGGGPSLQARMQYRCGSFVHHGDASYRNSDDEQAANDAMADLDRENAEWAAHDARQAAHNIRNQIRESLKLSGKNLEHPKGVDVLITGLNQSILDEDGMGGNRNTTDIDRQAADLIAAGHVVIVVNADDMSTLMSTDFHAGAIQTLGSLVQGLEGLAGGSVPINIEGFSRGAGAAIALTNELTRHCGFSGGDISTYVVDPFVGAQNNRVKDPSVDVQVYHSTLPGPVNVGAFLFGFHREVFQNGRGNTSLAGLDFPVFHGQMDSFDPGVLGLVTNRMTGGW